MEKMSAAEQRLFNDTFLEQVESGNVKEAAVSAQAYTRSRLREDSFAEKILTPIDISNSELDRAQDPELLVKWCDREPDNIAPAVSVPFGVAPEGMQFKGNRYPVYINRIMSPLFNKDIDRLRGYNYDIRQIMLEISTKDIATEVDSKFMTTVNSVLGTRDVVNSLNGFGIPSYYSISGGITRSNIVESMKPIQRMKVPFGPFMPDGASTKGVMLMNNITAQEFLKFERTEAGGDLSQSMLETGELPKTLFGVKSAFTIKSDLVPDNTVYYFTSEEFLGKFFRLQPLTVWMKNEAFFLSFMQYMSVGISLASARGIVRVDFV